MKVGDLVLLNGSMWSSYGREGEVGLLLETKLITERSGYPDAEFSRVLWDNGESKLYKSDHLKVISESR
jgi:hypothetical protein|tara:strand:+ start:187 stop:393 length:207 start_codon:yes stop_codon:yes gene_type:complete